MNRKIWTITLILLLLVTCWSASAYRYEFQDDAEGWINQKILYTSTGAGGIKTWISTNYYPADWRVGEYLDLHHIGMTATAWGNEFYYNLEKLYAPDSTDANKGYLAFTYISGYCVPAHGGYNHLVMYHDTSTSNLDFNNAPTTYSRVEFISEGQGMQMYIDGVPSSYWSSTPLYKDYIFESVAGINAIYCLETSYVNIDDVVIGSQIPNLVSTFPKYWYLMEDPADPTLHGLYCGDDMIYSDIMHSTWSISTRLPVPNPYTDYKIITKHQQTDTVVNTTSINTSVHKAGIIEYNTSTMLFDNPQAPYGNYIQTLYGDEQVLDTTSFMYISGGGNILFDKDQYYSGYNGTVGWDIGDSFFDLDTYTYCAKIQHLSGTIKTSWPITQKIANKSITWDEGDPDGTYIVSLIVIEKETQKEYHVAYDLCSYATVVTLQGVVYDAETATPLPGSTVTIQQTDVTHTPPVDATTAEYNVTELVADSPIIVTGSATGYVTDTYTFTPLQPKIYTQNIYLLPENISHADNSTAIAGLVQSSPYHQAIKTANITVSNINYNVTTTITINSTSTNTTYTNTSTTNSSFIIESGDFSTSVLTNIAGFFLADNLPTTAENITVNSTTITNAQNITITNTTTTTTVYTDYTYSVTTEKSGYVSPTPETVTATIGEVSVVNILLSGIYQLQVQIRDATTHALILDPVFIELQQDGVTIVSQDTSLGNTTFLNLNYGIYTLLSSAKGYYTNQKNVLVDADTFCTVYLNVKRETGAGVNYPPHNVKFAFKTLWGAPIVDAVVTVQGFETTAGAWDWFISLIGLDTEETPIQSAEMNGTTDTNGEINFMMIESVKYHIIADKDDLHTDFDLYPKDDYYPITVGIGSEQILGGDDISTRDISINVTTTREDNLGHIHVQYTDTGLNTDYVKIDITQINATNTSAPEDLIQTYGVADTNDFTHTFDETECSGQQFFVRITITHETGTVYRDYGVSFKGPRVRLGNIPDELYIYVAALGLCIIGCIFGATSANQGMIIVSFTAWIFFAFGWLDDLGLMGPVTLSFATVLSVLAIIMRRYHEEGYT